MFIKIFVFSHEFMILTFPVVGVITNNTSNFASGVYFFRMTSNEFSDVKKMVLLK